MNLSIAVITAGKPYAVQCLAQCRAWADMLGADLVVAGDKDDGVALAKQYADTVVPVDITNGLGESVVPLLAQTCANDWVLRFDDDETGTDALLNWLLEGAWVNGNQQVYAFPRAWLWGDEQHFITNTPLWPDVQSRMMKKELTARWENAVHAGTPAGTGPVIPVALAHYKFLVRTFAERQATARTYDALQPGAGSGDYYGRFTLPELFYVNGVTVRELGDGEVMLDEWINTGEMVPCSRKTGHVTMPIGKGAWNPSVGNRAAA